MAESIEQKGRHKPLNARSGNRSYDDFMAL
jgi:hypothetical protein